MAALAPVGDAKGYPAINALFEIRSCII